MEKNEQIISFDKIQFFIAPDVDDDLIADYIKKCKMKHVGYTTITIKKTIQYHSRSLPCRNDTLLLL